MKTFVGCFLILNVFILINCKQKSRWNVSLTNQQPSINFYDTYLDFYNPDISLKELKKQYPIFFPRQGKDSIQIQLDNDTNSIRVDSLNINAYHKTQEVFGNLDKVKIEVTKVIKRLNYHFPDLDKFNIYFTVGLYDDYTKPILFNPQTGDMFVALDLFLGADYLVYDEYGYPEYFQKSNMVPERIVALIALEIAEQIVTFNPRQNKFLDELVYNGKKMIVVDALLPEHSNEQKIGYTTSQLKWCKENETEIWKYFVENDLLFNGSDRLIIRFLQPSPYTKFGTEAEQDSPGRVGIWVGWQICKAYLAFNRNVSLSEFGKNVDYQKIYTESGYKP